MRIARRLKQGPLGPDQVEPKSPPVVPAHVVISGDQRRIPSLGVSGDETVDGIEAPLILQSCSTI
jgi:hypothetical protein